MKRLLLALTLAVGLTVPAFAAEILLGGCTLDNRGVTLVIEVDDALAIEHPVVAHTRAAFSKAASSMTAEDFVQTAGFRAFGANLDEFDKEAITRIAGIPKVEGICKLADSVILGR